MKKIIALAISLITLCGVQSASAQKFGHIDSEAIIQALPDTKAAQTALESESKKFDTQYQAMGQEYQSKVQAFQENENLAPQAAEKWSEAIKADKYQEIMQLQERIQRFQDNAQVSLQNKQKELYAPIMEKIDNAVKKVATTGGYIYIFDKNGVLFINTELSTDLTDAVKKELGI